MGEGVGREVVTVTPENANTVPGGGVNIENLTVNVGPDQDPSAVRDAVREAMLDFSERNQDSYGSGGNYGG